MKKDKEIMTKELREFLSKCGSKGGSKITEKKSNTSRRNGLTPCKPGRFRGRPPKLK